MRTDRHGLRRGSWYDRWLVSDEPEELETGGLSDRGKLIIEELNNVYERTGVLRRFVRMLSDDIERARRHDQGPVKILDVGMRDGTLLHLIRQYGVSNDIDLELHGVEFREDLAVFAGERCDARGDEVHVHHDPSRALKGVTSSSIDIVCSTFMLHHLIPAEAVQMLATCDRAARLSCVHLDLARSVLGVASIWLYYSLTGCTASRADSVLSCRRALTRNEAAHLIESAGLRHTMIAQPLFPIYLLLRRTPGVTQ